MSYQASLLSWVYQEEPDVDYEWLWIGNELVIAIQFCWPFDDSVYLVIEEDGNVLDYMEG